MISVEGRKRNETRLDMTEWLGTSAGRRFPSDDDALIGALGDSVSLCLGLSRIQNPPLKQTKIAERTTATPSEDTKEREKKVKYNVSPNALSRSKISDESGIRTHAPEETRSLVWRLRPLGHLTMKPSQFLTSQKIKFSVIRVMHIQKFLSLLQRLIELDKW